MALRDRLKGALKGGKAKSKLAAGVSADAAGESELQKFHLDRNQCWAILMARIDSTAELSEHDWFDPTIEQLIEIGLLQAIEQEGKTTWRLTGLGEKTADYLSKSGVRLTIGGQEGAI